MLPNLPTDIWREILISLPTSDQAELFEVIPELRSEYANLFTVIRFIRKDQNDVGQWYEERHCTSSVHTVTLPGAFVEEISKHQQDGCFYSESLKSQIDSQISLILSLPSIVQRINNQSTSTHNFILQFAFDLSSVSTYDSVELYPIIRPYFQQLRHKIEILKSPQSSIFNFTKSKNGTLNLFDCCYSASLSSDKNKCSTVIPRDFKDLIINTEPQIIQLNSGELIQTCHYLQDIPKEQRVEIFNIHTSNLKEISIVTPITEELNSSVHSKRNGHFEEVEQHELNYTYKNWDMKISNLAYSNFIKTRSASLQNYLRSLKLSNIENQEPNENPSRITHPYSNLPNLKSSQNAIFKDIDYSLFYETLYYVFNHSSEYELSEDKEINLETHRSMASFWERYKSVLYENIRTSLQYLNQRGSISKNKAKFVKIQILSDYSQSDKLLAYKEYFNDVFHCDGRHEVLVGLLKGVLTDSSD
ncbi:hypothetical protein WICPIJ_002304 [Wickerhamomyces pijperi]|uniref:F-box domain-containing protein n=1 Tax=Wickerhamomyces pijperi TaxID=599730 RepID=A0A9P8QC51_WICPI|nr:hypothetical protein WICPIJ_002304 [Wickerhamomyces pijperi]